MRQDHGSRASRAKNLLRKQLRSGLVLVLAAAVVGTVFYLSTPQTSAKGAKKGKAGGAGKYSVVSVTSVSSSALTQVLTIPGQLSPSSTSNVYPSLSGQVTKVLVTLGQNVSSGTPLIQLSDSQDIAGQLSAAQAALSAAQDALVAAEAAPQNAMYTSTVSADQAKVSSDETQVQILQSQLNSETVVAPIGGVVSAIAVSVGDQVTQNTLVGTVQGSGLQVDAMLYPSQASELQGHIGVTAVVSLADATSNISSTATLTSLGVTADPTNGDFTAVFSLAAPTSLSSGEAVTVTANVGAGSGLVAPVGSIVYPSGFPEVFEVSDLASFHGALKKTKGGGKKAGSSTSDPLVKKLTQSLHGETGVATLVPVTLGIQSGEYQQITSGVTAGSVVVTTGETDLSDGAKVMILSGKVSGSTQGNTGSNGTTATSSGRGIQVKIVKVTGTSITFVNSHKKTKTLSVASNAKITVGGKTVKLSQLKPGSSASVHVQVTNGVRSVISIDVLGA